MQKVKLIDPAYFNNLITKQGFTQRSLAKSAGISDTTLNLLINGKRCVGPTISSKITSTLGCSFDDIFFIINDYKSNQSSGQPANLQKTG